MHLPWLSRPAKRYENLKQTQPTLLALAEDPASKDGLFYVDAAAKTLVFQSYDNMPTLSAISCAYVAALARGMKQVSFQREDIVFDFKIDKNLLALEPEFRIRNPLFRESVQKVGLQFSQERRRLLGDEETQRRDDLWEEQLGALVLGQSAFEELTSLQRPTDPAEIPGFENKVVFLLPALIEGIATKPPYGVFSPDTKISPVLFAEKLESLGFQDNRDLPPENLAILQKVIPQDETTPPNVSALSPQEKESFRAVWARSIIGRTMEDASRFYKFAALSYSTLFPPSTQRAPGTTPHAQPSPPPAP